MSQKPLPEGSCDCGDDKGGGKDGNGGEKGGDEADDVDDDADETLWERLEGLLEMFPDNLIKCICHAKACTNKGILCAYSCSRTIVWIIFSTSLILFAPVIFEVERAQMEEMQKNQHKQLLLGPNSAISQGVPPPIIPTMKN